jgi:hypothetical protein
MPDFDDVEREAKRERFAEQKERRDRYEAPGDGSLHQKVIALREQRQRLINGELSRERSVLMDLVGRGSHWSTPRLKALHQQHRAILKEIDAEYDPITERIAELCQQETQLYKEAK